MWHILQEFLHGRIPSDAVSQYPIVFFSVIIAIIFLETGFVIFPFLPGDSLLFLVGIVLGGHKFFFVLAIVLLSMASITGNMLNYFFGNKLSHFFIKKISAKNFQKAEAFYKRHGAFAIVFSRFAPILRSIAPFIAGMTKMPYRSFMLWNIVSGVLWIGLLVTLGFTIGQIKLIKNNFHIIIIAILVISVIPVIVTSLKNRKPNEN